MVFDVTYMHLIFIYKHLLLWCWGCDLGKIKAAFVEILGIFQRFFLALRIVYLLITRFFIRNFEFHAGISFQILEKFDEVNTLYS